MARVYKRNIRPVPEVDFPDWHLIERLGELFAHYQTDRSNITFTAEDSRGEHRETDLAAFRAAIETQDELPKDIDISLRVAEDAADLHFHCLARRSRRGVWVGRGLSGHG